MTTRKYSSRSQQTTLTAGLSSSATTASVVSGTALLGGVTISAGETFTVVIDPDTALEEIVDVTAVSGSTLTITRGIDGSSGQEHSAGAVVRHMAIGRDYREANTHIEATSGVHGITGSLVGTTDTQTLTNKTLTTPTIGSFANATHSHLNAAGGGTITSAAISDFQESVEDVVGAMVSGNSESGISVTYDDVTGKYNFDVNDPVITLAGDVTGSATMTNLGNTTITATIPAGTIVDADINSAAAIDKTKISGTAVTLTDTGTVTSTMILNGTIVDADINATAAIAKTKISGTAITAADTGTVTSTMIADGTIVNGDISATAAIAKSKLDLGGTITSADIVDGTIVNSDINASAGIALSKLATDPLARANHTGTQLASTISDFDTQVRTSKVTDLTAPTGSFSMNSQKITNLGTPTTTGDAATKDYVDTQVSALVNGAPSTLDTLKEIADAISSGGTFYDAVVLKGGSTMTGALVLNADPSVNLGAATKQYVDAVAGSATAAAASAAAAATTYDNFDDRYLGAKASAPSVDNDGNALITGAIYWNSTTNAMYAWTGTEWGSISSTAAIFRYKFLPSAGATSVSGTDANGVTLSYLPGKEQVYLNGVLLVRDTDYTASNGTSITSISAMASGDVLEVITFTAFELATAIDKTILDAKGDLIVASAADTPGKLTAGTDGYYLQADSTQALGLKWAAVSGYSAPTLGSTSITSGATVSNVNGLTINSTTIPTSKTIVDTDSSQTLTNKTLTSPTINGAFSGSVNEIITRGLEENVNVVASAATGTINFDVATASVWYYTSNATANHTLNFRYNSSTSLSSKLAVGDAITLVWLNTNGSTAYYPNTIQIDGSTVTPKVPAAISAGNASAIDAYSFTIIKTAATPTYTVLETQTKFA